MLIGSLSLVRLASLAVLYCWHVTFEQRSVDSAEFKYLKLVKESAFATVNEIVFSLPLLTL